MAPPPSLSAVAVAVVPLCSHHYCLIYFALKPAGRLYAVRRSSMTSTARVYVVWSSPMPSTTHHCQHLFTTWNILTSKLRPFSVSTLHLGTTLFLRGLGVPMVAVATMVVGPLVKIVMEKVSSGLLDQYKVMKGMEEQHDILKRKLPAILDIIADAEQAAAHREGAAAWLEAIKKVAYQASEVFDEFKYDEVLVAEMNAFRFKYRQQPPVSKQWRQTDHVFFDPNQITRRSRDKDSKKIVDILVGQANNAYLTVIPIVGMGGLGKTTLAQLVYNDPEVQKHFSMLMWVCVSDSFDVDSLAKSIVEAAPRKMDDGTEADEDASKKKMTPRDILQNVVSGQRYLLVLDDVWTREVHKWEQLKACLEHGGMGSVVLTTTRDEGVAKIMKTVEAYNLTALEDKFIKEIVETRAFIFFWRKEDRPGVLVNMLDEIVKRCCGSPLAAAALGSVLGTKTSEEEWKAVSSSSSICTEETGILPILKLSYNDLPSHMKQCFAFCAIFPKDYKIDVDKLIQLWIAHGFIQEKHIRAETIGKQIFNELASRSFFQDVKQVKSTAIENVYAAMCYSRTTCKIHDLMHDIALSVMEKECALATKEPCQSEWLPDTARHLFLACEEPEGKLNSSLEKRSSAIQTLLCDDYMEGSLQHLSNYTSLQALQVCLHRRSFPLKPKHLHHLRYLDLSGSHIRELPKDMSILYNLQTLNVSGCEYLGGLPRQMKYMTALRHVYTHGCPQLENMPRDLRKLTSLQTLTCFVAGSGSKCSNVGELKNLNLGGQLELHHLENVTEEDAIAANLMKKKDLRELSLKWTVVWDYYKEKFSDRDDEDDARVLESLKPHDGLHAIRIHSYGATTFPAWMPMLQNIVEIRLFHCKKLQWLFDCDTSFTFPNLKELTLEGLVCLERWWEIDNDELQGELILFPRLEKLFINHCEKLTTLPGHPTFPNLQNAHIVGCPELRIAGKSPELTVLNMEGHEVELFLWVARHMTSLTNLELRSHGASTETTSAAGAHGLRELVENKKNWNDYDFPLAVLVLNDFKSGLTELCACFVHLQELSIVRFHALVHWPEKEFRGLVSLRRLMISFCSNLTGYARDPAEPSTTSPKTRQLLPRLASLGIRSCHRLVEVFDVPVCLRRMVIYSCSLLEFVSGMRLHQGQPASSIHQRSSSIPEVSSSSPGAEARHLEKLKLIDCHGLKGILHLPQSLRHLNIAHCSGLTSLTCHSGGLTSLESLVIKDCKILSSLSDGLQAYSSLRHLEITECPVMKTFPASLQQQLGRLQYEYIDARYYGSKQSLCY